MYDICICQFNLASLMAIVVLWFFGCYTSHLVVKLSERAGVPVPTNLLGNLITCLDILYTKIMKLFK